MKKLYCFDFDGTITKKDTMFSFLKFYNKRKFYLNFMKHLPFFIILKLNLKGEKETKIQQKAISFFEKNYPYILREKALNFIQNIDRNNSECYLVTASLDIWVKPFSEKLNLKLLSTQAKFEHGIYIGEFATKNCNGIEKVNRIKEVIKNQSFDKTIAFGDNSGDKEMLTWADESHSKFFH